MEICRFGDGETRLRSEDRVKIYLKEIGSNGRVNENNCDEHLGFIITGNLSIYGLRW
jgi:hypothetical protein